MQRFHVIDDAAVILRSSGVYRQAKVYSRGVELYAGHAGGFIGLMGNGGTTRPNVSWVDLDARQPTQRGEFGRPILRHQ